MVIQTLGEHYVTTTQLAYGKVGMHELGRDVGPLLTMLTKWPVAISSDVYYKLQKKQYGRLAAKYFAPLMAMNLASAAILDTNDKRVRKYIGADGFGGWLPIHSVWSLPNVATPVALSSAAEGGYKIGRFASKAMMGEYDRYSEKELKAASKRMVQQFVPVFGGIWRAYDNNIKIWEEYLDSRK